jgi:hypothetical protein
MLRITPRLATTASTAATHMCAKPMSAFAFRFRTRDLVNMWLCPSGGAVIGCLLVTLSDFQRMEVLSALEAS